MKRALLIGIIIGLIILLPVAYYLISPIFRVVEADDASPLQGAPPLADPSALDHMDDEMKQQFMDEMEKMADEVMIENEQMPQAQLASMGTFMPSAHEVEGRALLIEDGQMRTLRFEDFETINGPELHIYLATDTSASDYVDLGVIKATRGNVNYEVPTGVDLEKYDHVLVWCEPFSVLFSYAQLD